MSTQALGMRCSCKILLNDRDPCGGDVDLAGIALCLRGMLVSARRRFSKWFLNLRCRQSAHRILIPAGRRAVAAPRTALRRRGGGSYLAGMLR